MVVQHNMTAMNANRYFGMNNSKLSKSLEKLSSGYAINRAGDNAAGLAVSEKMRAQISGLTQAAKNAQDGISMTQTFEGALTETDSILQRMRSLAVQSANGSYDNSVDRAAIQLEYDQLNDELDQIADTDYNGVVVLNGGVMADGTKAAANGAINYTANAPRTDAKQWATKEINTIDNTKYVNDSTSSDNLWKNLGLTTADDEVEITFKYDKDSDTWAISDSSSATALKNKGNLTVTKGATSTKNNGGFAIATTTNLAADSDLTGAPAVGEVANVVLDSTKLVNGDTVTIKFTRPEVKNTAPENIGMTDGSYQQTASAAANAATATLTVNGGADDAGEYESTNSATAVLAMTENAAKSFNGLNGASIELTQTTAADDPAVETRTIKITLADGTTASLTHAVTGDTAVTSTITSDDGIKYAFSFDKDGSLKISDKDGKELASIDAGAVTGGAATSADSVTEKFTIALDNAIYSDVSKPSAAVVDPEKSNEVSESNSNNASTAKLTYTDNITLQVGARTKDSVNFTMSYQSDGIGELNDDLNCTSTGLGTKALSLATQESANKAIDQIDNAINKVSMVRGTFGALQNRLEHKIDNLNTTNENLTAAESRIRDTNMAEEMMNFTKNQILSQASQSMLAQANQLPQGVLSLLQ